MLWKQHRQALLSDCLDAAKRVLDMKDLIEAILKGLTGYIPLLAKVVAAPRVNVPRLVNEPSDPLRHALVFCGISLAISFAVQAPLLAEGQDFVTSVGAFFLVKLFELLVFNAILVLLFKMIGGSGTFEQTLTVSLYVSGPVYVFVTFAQIIGLGLLAGQDTRIAMDLRFGTLDFTSPRWADFTNTHPMEGYGLIALSLFTIAAVIAWFLHCWSIYRHLHDLSRLRSGLAYIIAFALFFAVAFLRVLAVRGLTVGTPTGIV